MGWPWGGMWSPHVVVQCWGQNRKTGYSLVQCRGEDSRVNPVGPVSCAMVGHYKNIIFKPNIFIIFCFRSVDLCYNVINI